MAKRKDWRKLDKRVNSHVKLMNRQVKRDFNGRYEMRQVQKGTTKEGVRYYVFVLKDHTGEQIDLYGMGITPFMKLDKVDDMLYSIWKAYNEYIGDYESALKKASNNTQKVESTGFVL